MSTLTVDESRLKDVINAAFVEVLEERPDLLSDALEEVLADVGLGYAIQEGERTPLVARDEALRIRKSITSRSVPCHFERSEKSLGSHEGFLTPLRFVRNDMRELILLRTLRQLKTA